MKTQEEAGWLQSDEEWVKKGERITEETIWAPTRDETKRWTHIRGEETWIHAPLSRRNTTWIDPQA